MPDVTSEVDLTDKARKICQDNYKDNCGGCPIRPACVAKIGYGLDGLNKWTTKVNKSAELFSAEGDSSTGNLDIRSLDYAEIYPPHPDMNRPFTRR
jgi:hypothetical protein